MSPRTCGEFFVCIQSPLCRRRATGSANSFGGCASACRTVGASMNPATASTATATILKTDDPYCFALHACPPRAAGRTDNMAKVPPQTSGISGNGNRGNERPRHPSIPDRQANRRQHSRPATPADAPAARRVRTHARSGSHRPTSPRAARQSFTRTAPRRRRGQRLGDPPQAMRSGRDQQRGVVVVDDVRRKRIVTMPARTANGGETRQTHPSASRRRSPRRRSAASPRSRDPDATRAARPARRLVEQDRPHRPGRRSEDKRRQRAERPAMRDKRREGRVAVQPVPGTTRVAQSGNQRIDRLVAHRAASDARAVVLEGGISVEGRRVVHAGFTPISAKRCLAYAAAIRNRTKYTMLRNLAYETDEGPPQTMTFTIRVR